MATVPAIIQYKLKYQSFESFTHSIIHLQARIPVRKAAKKPMLRLSKLISDIGESISRTLFAILPKIKGITIRKEKR